MIKYLGSKRTLLPDLLRILSAFPELTHVGDLFSGTSRVGHALKRAGYRVHANDHNAYAHVLAGCYVEADREAVAEEASRILAELSALPGRPGYVTETFCERSRFFQPKNGERIDAIRDRIEEMGLEGPLRTVVLTSLMEAADRVDSTCGVQMAYVKRWSGRSHNDLELRLPDVLPRATHGPGRATALDANALARELAVDVAYVDPPYNQHSYLGNYHIWETLARWDHPETYGVACKRIDVKTRKSRYNSKRFHHDAFRDLIANLDAALIVVSFSDEGYQSRDEIEETLRTRGRVTVVCKAYRRYVGARIGIHNPAGEKVGRVSHLENEERIYVVATERGRELDVAARLGDLTDLAASGERLSLPV